MRVPTILVIVFIGIAGATVTGCASAQQRPAAPAASAAPPAADAPLPGAIRWMQGSAEYTAAALQTYRIARVHVETAAQGRAPGSWAVVLDADDTVINNLQYQIGLFRDGATHSADRFTAFVREQVSTPVPGAAGFLTRIREMGGRIAIVTNRMARECDDTAAMLRQLALAHDAVLCRPEGEGSSADKNPRFRAVADGRTPASGAPVEVLAFLGDNIHDFPGGSQAWRAQGETAFANFGVRWFVLPNPMYGSWQ
jgi:5'-nucleotidase (lipoprotein e(P4) family)